MKHTHDIPASAANTDTAHDETRHAAKWRGQEGVTLIELVVAVIVLGILSALAVTNWSSFMRHQELRQDAIGLHREILALKARALDNGDTIRITYSENANSCNIQTRNAPGAEWTTSKTIRFSGNVRITTAPALETSFSPTITVPTPNNWLTAAGAANPARTIVIANNNLNAFRPGWIMITDTKRQFLIIKDAQSVNPLLYYRNGTSGQWKKV